MKKTAIEIKNLSKKYLKNKGVQSNNPLFTFLGIGNAEYEYVLQDISLTINSGDIIGIIGANGAGKSTFLKILSGITAPTEGEITIKGKVASILELGIGFDMELSGYENIFNGGQLLGFSKKEIKQNLNSIIEFSGLKDYIYTPVKHYSSGMLIRLAYSLVTNIDADILLFDEILAVGDIEFSQKVLTEIFSKVKQKKTILFVSHDINFIPVICNKVMVFKDSKLFYYGDTNTGISIYKEKYIQKSITDFEERLASTSNTLQPLNNQNQFIENNDSFKLISIRIQSKNKRITMNDEIILEILFENKLTCSFLDMGFIVYSLIDKGPVFTTALAWNKPESINEQGNYIINCSIPSNFLNAGNYSVNFSVITESKTIFSFNNISEFVIHVDESDMLSKISSKAITSMVPALQWKVTMQ